MAIPVKITFEEAATVRRMAILIEEIMVASGRAGQAEYLREEYAILRAKLADRAQLFLEQQQSTHERQLGDEVAA